MAMQEVVASIDVWDRMMTRQMKRREKCRCIVCGVLIQVDVFCMLFVQNVVMNVME